ncbi:serine/threonine protein kinase [Streptomonospora wellingtoniae]|uniref:Protein kinase n=1 Tax=Streptomonospora wellingtoniae TaxID=3075544 RepID=A0ABU2KSX8_9ACTN|nr:protein kinase [Streptomonospora sp. DSM 45055]MDT0302387.1 protein kinase [Streptomonospora sp. DSM 45055]
MAMSAGFPEGEELPERVGPYRIRRRIGQGGMGVVYQAIDPREDRLVAIKVLRSEVAGDHIARARLAREVATMRRVHSANVAEVIDADTDAELPWVVTEYIPGPTLDSTVTDHGPLRGRALSRFVTGLARAIGDIHAADVIHRDLKPGNVIISNGEPIVIDFGIAHAVDGAKLTQTGTFVGTPSYLSPEVIEGTDLGPATDIHAWGATVAFASTGTAPYGSGSFEVIFFRILNGEISLDGMPSQLQPLVQAAVSRDMSARPTAAGIVAQAGRLNLDLPLSEDVASYMSSGMTGKHTVQASTHEPSADRGGRPDGGDWGAAAAAGAGAGAAAAGAPAAGGWTSAPESGAAGSTMGAGADQTRVGGADQTRVGGADQTYAAGAGGADQTRVGGDPDDARSPQQTGRLGTYEADDSAAAGPSTQYFNSTLRPEDFRDILTPVDERPVARRSDRGETEERGGYFDRFRRSGGDRLGDYIDTSDEDDSESGYDRGHGDRPLPWLLLIPALAFLAGLCLTVPVLGLIVGLLTASVLGALDTVKSEHARRLQTRGPRNSDNAVIVLSMPWALLRTLGRNLLYGLGYLLAGIVVGIVITLLTSDGTNTPNFVGSYAFALVVVLSFLGPNGRGAVHQARSAIDSVTVRSPYVYWGVIVVSVLLAMLVCSYGIGAAPSWWLMGNGPSGWALFGG